MRGEQNSLVSGVIIITGSSPHAWGTEFMRLGKCQKPRVIPTCVGNRSNSLVFRILNAGHPHMRGEQVRSRANRYREGGSSPHAWGTVNNAILRTQQARVIPTCVGNSKQRHVELLLDAGHPHMRGEQCSRHFGMKRDIGSSPHAWGTVAPLKVFCLL